MYLEFERRAKLAELDARYFHPKELDGVRVREPDLLVRAVMVLSAALRAALTRHGKAIPHFTASASRAMAVGER